MKKSLVVAGVATTLSLSGLAGLGIVHAATNTNVHNGPSAGLVDAIASKFNLNKTDVQQVFDDQHAKMQADREQQIKDNLAQLVKDGKLTQAQADLITSKRAEIQKQMEANRDANQSLTPEQRRTAMEKQRTDLETWATQNNIDKQYLHFVFGGGHGPGGHGGHGMMMQDTDDK